MSTKNLKLTSVRIDPDTLEKINQFAQKHEVWTRNAVINSILTAVMERFSDSDVYDMCRTSYFENDPITAIYKINDLPKPKEQ